MFQASDSEFGILTFVVALFLRLLPYRMTLSALAKTFGGIVNPICFAALRLMMS